MSLLLYEVTMLNKFYFNYFYLATFYSVYKWSSYSVAYGENKNLKN